MAYRQQGPTFAICGTFSGTNGVPASRWLVKYNHEMKGYKTEDGSIPADTYLEFLNVLLTDDAADWAESHPDAVRLLNEPEPTQATVDSFKALFCNRFPTKAVEITPVPFDIEVQDLRQNPEESLASYYRRTISIMQRVGLKDRQANNPVPLSSMAPMESAMLDTVLRAFTRGLANPETRMEATRAMSSENRSLRTIYNLAEEARRMSIEIQKLHDEEARANEFQIYKDLVQKNIPSHQVASLLASRQVPKQTHQAPTQPHYQSQPWSQPNQARLPEPSHEAFRNRSQPQQQNYDRRSYQSEAPPTLASNPSKGNVGRGGFAGSSRRQYQPTPKDLPDRLTSKNPYINGTNTWSFSKDGQLCVKCGTPGHGSPACGSLPLPAWEQSYLKMIVFGENPQSNFAAVGFGDFDGAVRPYGSNSSSPAPSSSAVWKPSTNASSSSGSGQLTPTSSIDSFITPRANCIQFGVAGINLNDPPSLSVDAKAYQVDVGAVPKVEAFLGEGSGPNKRAHVEEEADQPIPRPAPYRPPEQIMPPNPVTQPLPTTAQPSVIQPSYQPNPGSLPQVPTMPQPNPGQSQPQPFVPPQVPSGSQGLPPAFPFSAGPDNRPKQKAKKRVGRRAEPQQLVGLYNEGLLKYDSPVSVRQVLQNTKIDMNWMDLVAWSPAICRELKRLCTRVPKKRAPKPAAIPQFIPPMPPAFAQFQPQYPMQAFQPQYGQQFPVQPIGNSQSSTQTLNPASQAITAQSFSVDVGPMTEDKHTKFLQTLIGLEKAFRVPSVVRRPDGIDEEIDKSQSQSDQGSDMNVISQGMVNHLKLPMQLLSDIGFKGLTMRTADHRETELIYWVWLMIAVEGIWRNIRCFVAPEVVSVTESGRSEYLSLILGIPWLYSVDAHISIRQSTIFIGDRSIGEEVRSIVGPEMVFCKDHNLLMYPKSAMVSTDVRVAAKQRSLPPATVEEVEESSESSESDDLSDIEDEDLDFQ